MYEVLGMIRQLGLPTWFLTLSAADMQWPDIIQTIAHQYGTSLSDDDVKNVSFEDKSKWLRQNPVTAAHHFHSRLQTFFQTFLKSSAHPVGELVDCIEFQARGSPHAYTILDQEPDEEVCSFIDRYVWSRIPEDNDDTLLIWYEGCNDTSTLPRVKGMAGAGSTTLTPQSIHSDCT